MTHDTDSGETEIRVDLLLDESARKSRLWEKARGRPWRPTFEDVGALVFGAALVAWFIWRGSSIENTPQGVFLFVIIIAFGQQWHTQRLRRRVDALVRLLEQAEARQRA